MSSCSRIGSRSQLKPFVFLVISSQVMVVGAATADEAEEQKDETLEISKEDLERAAQLYTLGQKLFDAGEFAEAAKAFGESYDVNPRPGALFNQGRCYEEAGQKKKAIKAFGRYMESSPDGDGIEEARIRKLALEQLVTLEKGEGKATGQSTSQVTTGVRRKSGGGALRSVGVTVGLAGVALLASGTFTGVKAQAIGNEFSGRPSMQWSDEEIARFNDGEKSDRRAVLLMSVGGAAVVGGVILYYVGHRMRGIEVAPVVTSDGAGANVSLRF